MASGSGLLFIIGIDCLLGMEERNNGFVDQVRLIINYWWRSE